MFVCNDPGERIWQRFHRKHVALLWWRMEFERRLLVSWGILPAPLLLLCNSIGSETWKYTDTPVCAGIKVLTFTNHYWDSDKVKGHSFVGKWACDAGSMLYGSKTCHEKGTKESKIKPVGCWLCLYLVMKRTESQLLLQQWTGQNGRNSEMDDERAKLSCSVQPTKQNITFKKVKKSS